MQSPCQWRPLFNCILSWLPSIFVVQFWYFPESSPEFWNQTFPYSHHWLRVDIFYFCCKLFSVEHWPRNSYDSVSIARSPFCTLLLYLRLVVFSNYLRFIAYVTQRLYYASAIWNNGYHCCWSHIMGLWPLVWKMVTQLPTAIGTPIPLHLLYIAAPLPSSPTDPSVYQLFLDMSMRFWVHSLRDDGLILYFLSKRIRGDVLPEVLSMIIALNCALLLFEYLPIVLYEPWTRFSLLQP